MKKNILLLGGDGTQTLPIAESLCKNNYTVHIAYHKKLSYGYACRYVKFRKQIDSRLSEAEYFNLVKQYTIDNQIDIIIPLCDSDAAFLSKNKNELLPYSNFIMPDYDVFLKGYSKNELMKVCEKGNFPHPNTLDLKQYNISDLKQFAYPAMLKPNFTTGGRGMVKVNTFEELMKILPPTMENYGECHLQEFINEGGKQFKVQLLVDEKCKLIQSSVIWKQRYYPEKAGSSCCNITIEDNDLVELCYSILQMINWIGFADFDLIEDPKDGTIKVMEINPRIPACIKSAVKSGADYGKFIAEASSGITSKPNTYRAGNKLRHIGFEMLWFFYSKNRFKTQPNWFKFFGKNLYFQDFSWSDPLPFIFGTIGNIRQQLSPEFRKAKAGVRG